MFCKHSRFIRDRGSIDYFLVLIYGVCMRGDFTKRHMRQEALVLAEGLFSHSVDLVLWMTVYFAGITAIQPKSGNPWRAAMAADRFLNDVNYDVIKNALLTAKKRHLIKKTKRSALPQITKAGKKRLQSVVPIYDAERTWDGRMHVVTYDIPEKKKRDRDQLREYLRRIGCAKLQDSVWVTPYNPIDTLRSFIQEKGLGGTIIVSDLGRDASIGDEDLHDLIVRIYGLKALNMQYEEWLYRYKRQKTINSYALITYLAILKQDPQLPFSLLPKWWSGENAYKKIRLDLTRFFANVVVS